ncbi:PA-phosphatase-like phosphoesterase [Clostridium pasteurianum DSM 525 = ATCC 6013]|uniref:PA-phosphatase-like phosphoesterase n=1 Tax=Clostridium pasteurianum DSM 525 = ATCC 6013 TaxID=1262449 RepID=A0A0H3J969_CLOPA|nr:phosphatase PAP2 family protein [Clostridium pasteurianum]AJA49822.1 PA-phosphatase-like phosphoesterase [Clostridium pasteurianum DSM 525 = ATCC 6013]AJA53810.1 PA-phosphatase-like phosphoesterase [Clostridium pasteurianum DSM 525 = ATCC 6013]AOZ76967.1 phospholipid phosphatase [Clostridium pasteurianum DSM 525 = ATCC 6013]AOZ80764.1 phospholipid phosphatase [Clostridium pasteurianum]ELP57781.1 PA-phosphatase-like phosphoesterase [Clostridium pasteurianum DSM 525 = ATCC 6013]
MNAFLDRIHRKDVSILMIFNNSIRCKPLDILMPIITYMGSAAFGAIFCIISFFYLRTRILSIETTASIILSSLIARFIKIHVSRIRPYITLKNLYTKKIGIDNYSFPSGHTTVAFSIGTIIALNTPAIGFFSILAAIAVGISRMYLGVHYPTDVFVGMILGTLTSLSIYFFIF